MSADRREFLEAELTFRRIVELELNPVVGNFDSAHLCEVNRRIFQDLPLYGFADVTPGKYRQEVPAGKDWLKTRKLESQPGTFVVAYSRMDAQSFRRMGAALENAKPDRMRQLEVAEFTKMMAKLYSELDYIHPFSDGNSRTLRSFTRQLARESGYAICCPGSCRESAGLARYCS